MFFVLSLFELCLRTDTVYDFYRSHPKNNSTISSSVWEAIDSYIPKNMPSVYDNDYYWWYSLGLSSKSKRLEFTGSSHEKDSNKKRKIWRETIEKLLPKTGDTFYFGEENIKIGRWGMMYEPSGREDRLGYFCYSDIITINFADSEKISTSVAFCLGCGHHFFTARYDKWGLLHNQNGKLALNLAAGEGHADLGGCMWDYWHGNLISSYNYTVSADENDSVAQEVDDWFGDSATNGYFKNYSREEHVKVRAAIPSAIGI